MASAGSTRKVAGFEFKQARARGTKPTDGAGIKRGREDEPEADVIPTQATVAASPQQRPKRRQTPATSYPEVDASAIAVRGSSRSSQMNYLVRDLAVAHLAAIEEHLGQDSKFGPIVNAVVQAFLTDTLVKSLSSLDRDSAPVKAKATVHPKDVEHASKAASLESETSQLKREISEWKAVSDRYATGVSADIALRDGSVSEEDDDSDEAMGEKGRSHASSEAMAVFKRFGAVRDLGHAVKAKLPKVFFQVDALAERLRETGAVLDTAAHATVAVSQAIRAQAFQSLPASRADPREAIKHVLAVGTAPSNADEALEAIAAGIGSAVSSESMANFRRLSSVRGPVAPKQSRTPSKVVSAVSAHASTRRSGGKGGNDDMPELQTDTPSHMVFGRPSVPNETPAILKKIRSGR